MERGRLGRCKFGRLEGAERETGICRLGRLEGRERETREM